ncbi:hypothetical protein SKAU_G00311840 [Synaphobranchus kaupii]|uniref:Uncharacterized protein n=1 Tax=Synaphobranchus kaupii TaxID=118154 RepID=A0A9Q1ILF3_SYNKA|nr:hypothetical protein SKAU_G00311840 [Synaphobranchus kaupii]
MLPFSTSLSESRIVMAPRTPVKSCYHYGNDSQPDRRWPQRGTLGSPGADGGSAILSSGSAIAHRLKMIVKNECSGPLGQQLNKG